MRLYNTQSLNYYYYVVMPCANDSNKHFTTRDTKTVVKHRHISLDQYNLLTLLDFSDAHWRSCICSIFGFCKAKSCGCMISRNVIWYETYCS